MTLTAEIGIAFMMILSTGFIAIEIVGLIDSKKREDEERRKRMNKDRAKHIKNIKKLKECATTYRNTVADTPQKEVSVVIGDKQLYLNDEMLQSLDHAINCVGAIEQIKWERDIAIQQLNELGYQFGEKIRSDEK